MRVFLFTVGCKLNQTESGQIAQFLREKGHTLSLNPEEADVIIVNTCAVTSEALRKSVKKFKHFRKKGKKVFVTGCGYRYSPDRFGESTYHISFKFKDSLAHTFPFNFEKARVFLKIEDGCYRRCRYCIPSRLRPYYSIPHEVVMEHIETGIMMGYHEFVLTGLNISLYRYGGLDLKGLMRLIARRFSNRDIIVRLSSVEPDYIDEEFLKILKDPVFAKHLHISFQSFSKKVIELMGRRAVDHRDIFDLVTKHFTNIGLGSDIIVGYSGEDDEEFRVTYNAIEGSPLTYLHIFPFSPRKGTPAYEYDDVDSHVKRERVGLLKKLDAVKRRGFRERQEGLVLRGIAIDEDTVLTENYIEFNLTFKANPRSLMEVLIKDGKGVEYGKHKVAVNS